MRVRLSIAAGALGLFLGAGCTQLEGPSSPVAPRSDTNAALYRAPLTETDIWNTVSTTEVSPGVTTLVQGSRYSLTFKPTSLDKSIIVTIKERDASIVDVELGPDGTVFESPVTLQVDYRGTANDPSQPYYNGQPPRLFWFDPDTKSWVLMPGTDDPKNGLYTVDLQHFSRYAMGDGTSGWEGATDDSDRGQESVK